MINYQQIGPGSIYGLRAAIYNFIRIGVRPYVDVSVESFVCNINSDIEPFNIRHYVREGIFTQTQMNDLQAIFCRSAMTVQEVEAELLQQPLGSPDTPNVARRLRFEGGKRKRKAKRKTRKAKRKAKRKTRGRRSRK